MTNIVERNIRVSLEMGSSTITVLVGEVLSDGVVNVIGFGSAPSRGIERGYIVDSESATAAIRRAVDQAENMSEVDIKSVTIAVGGAHIISEDVDNKFLLPDGEITENTLEKALDSIKPLALQAPQSSETHLPAIAHREYSVLHIIPQEYRVDALPPTKNPIGMEGKYLHVQAQIIRCRTDFLMALKKAAERANLTVSGETYSGLATAEAVLSEEEKDLGVCIVDIGGGTMDICVYTAGHLRYVNTCPYGGIDITKHIVGKFAISRNEAERIKVKEGSALYPPRIMGDKRIEVVSLGGRVPCLINRTLLAEPISYCYQELFKVVQENLVYCQRKLAEKGINNDLIAGIVLTGGGSEAQDIVECAKSVFNTLVRVGVPINIAGITDHICKPQYSTVFGLLQYDYLKNSEIAKPIVMEPEWLKKTKKLLHKYYIGLKNSF